MAALIAPINTGDDQQRSSHDIVDVANTIARGVRVKTIINHRQRIFNIGSRLIIIVPIIAWCGIFISWTFITSAAVLTIGIVTIAQLRRLTGEWVAIGQILLMLIFMMYYDVTPFVAINWAVLGIASTWPLVRYPRLGLTGALV